ncbi:hypothetical protein [Brevibacillus daliensis]|uniref:hypothetical protein n=1 Tax=Brevibacillus daliensis TaxID=2892995 RepID=UPI001E2E1B16|nr:hypothetical protein [Brevibacillus daliensis]
MATVHAYVTNALTVDSLIGIAVRYQKHKPGNKLLLEAMPKGTFRIQSVRQFGEYLLINDGEIMLEGAPTVGMRNGRIALLLPTGEELYLLIQ